MRVARSARLPALLNFMMKPVSSIVLLCLALSAESAEWYFEADMYGFSQTSSIDQIVRDDFEGDIYDRGEHSFTQNRWELGVVFEGFKIAALARYDYTLNYSEDSADLVYADKNDLPIETDRTYRLHLDALHMRSHGLKLGYHFPIAESFAIAADVSLLQTTSYIDGSINGQVTVLEDDYIGDVSLDYAYSKDRLLDRVTPSPNGYGYTLDVLIDWQPWTDLELNLSLRDILNRIEVSDAPFTAATASSNRVNLSPTGQLDVKPVLSGVEGFRDQRIKLRPNMRLDARYRVIEHTALGLGVMVYDDYAYPELSVNHTLASKYKVSGSFNTSTKAIGFGFGTEAVGLKLQSDDLDLSNAKTLGLSFYLRH